MTSSRNVQRRLFFCFLSVACSRCRMLSDVSLTDARFSDRIRSEGGRLYPERLCRPTLQLSAENTPIFASGQREQVTERINLFNYTQFPFSRPCRLEPSLYITKYTEGIVLLSIPEQARFIKNCRNIRLFLLCILNATAITISRL